MARRAAAAWTIGSAALWLPAACHAVGGQFAVDDAYILDPGQCQIETWTDRQVAAAGRLTHFGPSCRVGPVELGLNIDRSTGAGAGATTFTGAQAKWTLPLTTQLTSAFVTAVAFDATHGGSTTTTVYAPLSFQTGAHVTLHANLGFDLLQGSPSTQHSGVAIDWTPGRDMVFTIERYRQYGIDSARVGVHYDFTKWLAVQATRTRPMSAGVPGEWTLGLIVAFPAP
ncbi:MAG: hypothetical protein JWQ11_629 [Rhizobacter sp.]|nr:hypothetical protein [Rhizobacter sp.]